jgi:hypothetical protein
MAGASAGTSRRLADSVAATTFTISGPSAALVPVPSGTDGDEQRSRDHVAEPAGAPATGAFAPAPEGAVTHWAGFQRRWAVGLRLERLPAVQ